MKTTRRSFVGAAGAALTGLPGFFRARSALADAPSASIAGPDAGMRPDAGTSAKAPAGLSQLARERYGKYLDDDQLKLLDAKLAEVEARSKRLHAFKLSNSDEPACEFRAVRS